MGFVFDIMITDRPWRYKMTQIFNKTFNQRLTALLITIILLLSLLCSCKTIISLDEIPEYSGKAYVEINGGEPFFTDSEITDRAFESYSPLDALGRCGVAVACIGLEIMPTEERGDLASITPTGWEYNGISNNNTYDFVDNEYVYNRCHLIGFQLAGENDNERNLITGTRYMNIEGMLPFENEVDDYVEETGNHVMYRVTPIYQGFDYVAREDRRYILGVKATVSGLIGFASSLLAAVVVEKIEQNGNLLFGRTIYPQQLLFFITAVMLAALVIFFLPRLQKKETVLNS